MPTHPVGTREEWKAAVAAVHEREQDLGKLDEEIARQRQEVPWVRVDKEYVFDTEDGKKTLPELFVHPAGYCQNVLSTGICRVVGLTAVGEREAIVVECDHPRTIEMNADRPDYRLRLSVDLCPSAPFFKTPTRKIPWPPSSPTGSSFKTRI